MTLRLDFDGRQFVITATIELDRSIVKDINGARAAGSKRWFLPATVPTYLDASTAIEDDGGEIGEFAQAWWAGAQVQIEKLLALKDETRYQPKQLGSVTVRPDQLADATFLATVGQGMVLHPPRFGKTYTISETISQLDKWPVLFVAKPKTIRDIEQQLRAAFPERTISVVASGMTPGARKKALAVEADIYIIGHNLAEKHSKILFYPGVERIKELAAGKYEDKELQAIPFKVVVVDEAHRANKPKSAITRATWAIGDTCEHRYIMTGTPAPNKEDEWWPSLRFCYPKLFPAKRAWQNRYVRMVQNYAGFDVPAGWNHRTKGKWEIIRSLMSVRREAVESFERVIRMIPVDLGKDQRKFYDELATEGMTFLDDELVAATDTMTLRHRLEQFAFGVPKVVMGKVVEITAPSPIMDAVIEILEESDEKAIVVCEHRTVADLALTTLEAAGYRVVTVLGGSTADSAYAAQKAIQEGDANVILMSKSGAEGLELSKATRVIMLEIFDDLAAMWQILNRHTSAAQKAALVEEIYVYAAGTIHEAKYAAFVNKDENLHNNLNDKLWVRRNAMGSA